MKAAKVPVITVDGPVGSGKGTVCHLLARKLGWNLLDSGSLYRLVALAALKNNISTQDRVGVCNIARELKPGFVVESGQSTAIFLDKEKVDTQLREEQVGLNASIIAKIPEVREQLLTLQRSFIKSPGLIADGRDMGTVVFPDASAKFFLTASAEERASRRYLQLQETQSDVSIDRILADVMKRDKMDTERAISPLRPAQDARVIDSTSLAASEVVERIINTLSETGVV